MLLCTVDAQTVQLASTVSAVQDVRTSVPSGRAIEDINRIQLSTFAQSFAVPGESILRQDQGWRTFAGELPHEAPAASLKMGWRRRE